MKSIFLISLLILSSTARFLYSNSNNPLPPHLRFLNSIKNPKIITNSLEEIFTETIEKFNIKFSSIDDFNEKKEIFKRNYQRISNHNQRYDEGKESYFMDVNQFTHLRDDELRRFNGLKIDENEVKNEFKTLNLNVTAPDAFDWLREGKVSKIQNQVRKFKFSRKFNLNFPLKFNKSRFFFSKFIFLINLFNHRVIVVHAMHSVP